MITLEEAFKKFKGRLELTDREKADASSRQTSIRELLRGELDIERDILTGSYARWTKTKPLKDVDIFCIMGADATHFRESSPATILEAFRKILASEYGSSATEIQRRSVRVDFGVKVLNDDTEGQVMSFDVVPAFAANAHYEIPDRITGGWIKTDPEVHKQKGVDANKAFSQEWKPLVKMVKKWNQIKDKPVRPSFLLEVMALEIFVPPFSGGYSYELKSFFSTAAERIGEVWTDPAGLGPPVSDQMDTAKVTQAQEAFRNAEEAVSRALRLAREGRHGDALQEWRSLFGPLFPLS